jgi:ABC-2 type transport system permease protein
MGGQVAFQIGTVGLVSVALMAIFMIGRETRAEEESGRAELVRAMAVGRHANAAAALVVVAGMSAVIGGVVALGLIGLSLPTTGSLLIGTGLCAEGLVFAGVTTVAAQFTENTRIVFGSAGAVLGAAFVVRAAGDIHGSTLRWLSPIGWAQRTLPFAGDRWWPLLVPALGTLLLVAAGAVLSTRRDIDAGFVPPRPGPRIAAARLGRPLGLALRLQRGALAGWSIGMFLTGAAFGWIANDVDELVGDNETMRKVIARLGGVSLTDSYLSSEIMLIALAAAGFAVQSALRLRGEEVALHAEPLLATPVSRRQWVASHLMVALAGSAIALAAGGLGSGLMFGISGGGLGQVPRMLGAALAYTPALWLFAGLATLLFGLAPRGVPIVWAAFAACFVNGLLGEVLDLPAWLNDVSPFRHVPRLPAEEPTMAPLAILVMITAVFAAGGVAAFRARDVG